MIPRKVFPGYLLVRMDLNDDSWYVVRNTPGVTGFVGSGTKPIPLSEREVDKILRRKGEPAWTMVGLEGELFAEVDDYLRHLAQRLPEAYLAGGDMKRYAETLRLVVSGQLGVEDAIRKMPRLKRVGGNCPCSRAVRWVVEEPAS